VKSGEGVDEMDNIQKLVYDHNKFAIEKRTIMICEDEPDVLLSFEQMLKSEFNIISVDSGRSECSRCSVLYQSAARQVR